MTARGMTPGPDRKPDAAERAAERIFKGPGCDSMRERTAAIIREEHAALVEAAREALAALETAYPLGRKRGIGSNVEHPAITALRAAIGGKDA